MTVVRVACMPGPICVVVSLLLLLVLLLVTKKEKDGQPYCVFVSFAITSLHLFIIKDFFMSAYLRHSG